MNRLTIEKRAQIVGSLVEGNSIRATVRKKVENLAHAVSLHYMHYNFARPHTALSKPYPKTPAMAAGVADHVWSLKEIAELLEASEPDGEPVEPEPPRPSGSRRARPRRFKAI